jgi:phospholipid/cholesterol/gamma-HCH transport system permease protein
MSQAKSQSAPQSYRAARISLTADSTIECAGAWTLAHLGELEHQVLAVTKKPVGGSPINFHVGAIEAMDSGGAWLLQRTLSQLERGGCSVTLSGLSPDFATLMQNTAQSWSRTENLAPAVPIGRLERIGKLAYSYALQVQSGLTFVGETAASLFALFTRAHRFRWRVLLHNLQIDGLNALPIIGLLSFLMGVVIAYQGAEQLRTFGANIFIVDLVGISLLREIAPLIAAILVAGRSGSAYAAQIGTMTVTEELDALRSLGISPMSLLVLPRAFALIIALPLLSVYADAVGVFGGMLIAWTQLGVTFSEFVNRFEYAIVLRHYLIGISKTPVFAMIIALVGCYQGFRVSGGVDSVGRHTTISVVQAIFLVIVTDAFFSILFSWWEI